MAEELNNLENKISLSMLKYVMFYIIFLGSRVLKLVIDIVLRLPYRVVKVIMTERSLGRTLNYLGTAIIKRLSFLKFSSKEKVCKDKQDTSGNVQRSIIFTDGSAVAVPDKIKIPNSERMPMITEMTYWFLKGWGLSDSFLKQYIIGFDQPFRLTIMRNVIRPSVKVRKIMNHYVAMLQRRIGYSRVYHYPTGLDIEPARDCLFKCPLCPRNDENLKLKRGKMPFSIFKKLIDEVGDYIFYIDFCYWGEPLLNEDLPKFITYAKKYDIITNISTNMNFLTDKQAERLVLSRPDFILIGLVSLNNDVYKKYTKFGNLEYVKKNIEKLNFYRKKYNQTFPRIYGYLWMTAEVEKNLKTYKKCAISYYKMDGLFLSYFFPIFYVEALKNKKIQKYFAWLPRNKTYRCYNKKGKVRLYEEFCDHKWRQPAVDFEGNIYPCWSVTEKKYSLGNINEDTLRNIWNSSKMRRIRAFHKNKKGDCRDLSIPCVHCGEDFNFPDKKLDRPLQ